MIDYSLWEVIENGATLPKTQLVEGVTTVMPITSAEDKAQRRLELQKRVESCVLFGEKNSQEDVIKVIKKFVTEWGSYILDLWRNKADLEYNTWIELYNNLKVQSGDATITQRGDMLLRSAKAPRIKTTRREAEEGQIMHSWLNSPQSLTSEFNPLHKKCSCPPTPDLSFTGLDEFVNKLVVENRKSDEEMSEIVRKNDDAPIIKEWVLNSEEENVSQPKLKEKS
ncbi:hypothetical protein Tco_1321421 [Tanacetum coccineum]